MEKGHDRRKVLKMLGGAALAAGALGASTDESRAIRRMDAGESQADKDDMVRREANEMDRLFIEIEDARKRSDKELEEQLWGQFKTHVERVKKLLGR